MFTHIIKQNFCLFCCCNGFQLSKFWLISNIRIVIRELLKEVQLYMYQDSLCAMNHCDCPVHFKKWVLRASLKVMRQKTEVIAKHSFSLFSFPFLCICHSLSFSYTRTYTIIHTHNLPWCPSLLQCSQSLDQLLWWINFTIGVYVVAEGQSKLGW